MKKNTMLLVLLVVLAVVMSGCPQVPSGGGSSYTTEEPQTPYLAPVAEEPQTPYFPPVEDIEGEDLSEPLEPVPAEWATLEQEVYELINQERVSAGLSELFFDRPVQSVARMHSTEMAENDYFSHTDLNGGTPRDRLTDAHIPWRAYGENLAYTSGFADTAAAAVEGWMESPGHRANVMNAHFTHAGVGVVCDANGAYYLTQNFVGY